MVVIHLKGHPSTFSC